MGHVDGQIREGTGLSGRIGNTRIYIYINTIIQNNGPQNHYALLMK